MENREMIKERTDWIAGKLLQRLFRQAGWWLYPPYGDDTAGGGAVAEGDIAELKDFYFQKHAQIFRGFE